MSTKVNLVPDENGNDPFVQISGTNIMQPIDIQSHLQTTIQTHNAVSVPASGASVQASWMDCNGFDQLNGTILNDGNAGQNITVQVLWSNDGVTNHGTETPITASTAQRNAFRTSIKARYAKFSLVSGDVTNAHTLSAWAYQTA